MSTEITTLEREEFERIKAAHLPCTGIHMVLTNGNSIIYLRESGEILFDTGDGVKKKELEETPENEEVFNAIKKLISVSAEVTPV